MVLVSTLVKVATLVTVLLLGGGSSYIYFAKHDTETQPTANLRNDDHHQHHHSEDHASADQAEFEFDLHGHHDHHDHEFHHVCDHGNFIKTLDIHVPETQEKSEEQETLQHEMHLRSQHHQGNWRPIRVLTDYTNFKASAQHANFIENRLMAAATAFFQTAYNVFPLQQLKVNRCSNLQVPAKLQSGVTGYDLVLFVQASHSEENWLARAGPCQLDPRTYRPTAGTVEFNLKFLNKINLNNINQDRSWYAWIQTTIHELTHVIGFSSGLFPYYINPANNQKLGATNVVRTQGGRDWIILPKVTALLKRHFGCTSAAAAPLENNGGQGTAGSHWERTTFGNEAMTGSDFPDSVFTEFTFSLMESTGWYLPNYQQAEPYNWGRGEGCGIVQGQCQGRAFCRSSGADNCSPDFTGIASCSTQDPLAAGCGYWAAYGNTLCKVPSPQITQISQNTGGAVGQSSRCFITTLPKAIGYQTLPASCYAATCSNNVITFSVGGTNYQCSRQGQVVNVSFRGRSGTVTCPDVAHFCATTRACPNQCSGVGTCRGTTCYCWKGYSGADCSTRSG